MQKNIDANLFSFKEFSNADQLEISRALTIIGQIPHDPHYGRPTGIQVAVVLAAFHIDLNTTLAAILSDPRLDNLAIKPDISQQFGVTVANLVNDVNWLNKVTVYTTEMANQPNQAEILRRMLLSMTQDIRAVLIKLAYRVQRLRNLHKESKEIQHFIAQETLDIYAPIANRLGIHHLKWELEDMAFRSLENEAYRKIAKALVDNRIRREECIHQFIKELQEALSIEAIQADVYGRPKHIYSIWRKMERKNLEIDQLHDLLAVRIIVLSLSACYAVLGLVHSLWRYIPKEFDDYIANPKANGYQSLHTVIIDNEGNRIEVQIRTRDMHDFAELGVAAHWSYKEGGRHNAAIEKSIAALRKMLIDKDDDATLLEDFGNNIFYDRVYVLTPAGKLIDLIKGATPLDFAYAVHSEIGHRCRGAKVNGRIVPLTYILKSGEQVEILTAKEAEPNYNWIDPNLGYLKSSRAISRVKSWFKNRQQSQNITSGKSILDRELSRLGIRQPSLVEMSKHFKVHSVDKLLESIGRSDINLRQISNYFKVQDGELEESFTKTISIKKQAQSAITVSGIDNVLTTYSNCCTPVPGDEIIGYISIKKGITIHRKDCANILGLNADKKNRLIPVNWGNQKTSHSVPIVIKAHSAHHVLNDVSQILAKARIHIIEALLNTHSDFSATLNLTILVENTDQLGEVLSKINCLPNIQEALRKI
ncbi:MAG: bifunctional (p)ppGpp synthetase/guanosine-3',5'-bis(diphosphate) 3'-pyrophosphohydrolase [Methylococcaceae bacterium]|jgi:GTP pyrophosphokinase